MTVASLYDVAHGFAIGVLGLCVLTIWFLLALAAVTQLGERTRRRPFGDDHLAAVHDLYPPRPLERRATPQRPPRRTA